MHMIMALKMVLLFLTIAFSMTHSTSSARQMLMAPESNITAMAEKKMGPESNITVMAEKKMGPESNITARAEKIMGPESNFTTRAEKGIAIFDCGKGVYDLKSCKSELNSFVDKSTTVVGPACCKAIGNTGTSCLTVVLPAVGLTMQQLELVRAYCGVAVSEPVPSTMVQSVSEPFPDTMV